MAVRKRNKFNAQSLFPDEETKTKMTFIRRRKKRRKKKPAPQTRLASNLFDGSLLLVCGRKTTLFLEMPPADGDTVNDALMRAQFEFLASGSKKAADFLWAKSLEVCRNLIKRRNKALRFRMSDDDLDDIALSAAEYVLRRYYNRKRRWRVRANFVKALDCGVTHALFYVTKAQKLEKNAVKTAILLKKSGFFGDF